MKMGELRIDPVTGEFVVQTPGGIRPVTLRVTHDGHVMVEEIAGGGMSIQPLKITVQNAEPAQGALAHWANQGARIADAMRNRD